MRSDIAVIGGGHNGLVTAAYLARAGLRTMLFERRPVLGGACVTEELWPGFLVSRAAYVAGLLRPNVIRELDLHARGLRLLRRDPASYTPLADGRGLLLGADAQKNHESIRAFSTRDAERYPRYEAFLDRVATALEPLLDAPAPDPARLHARDLRPLFALARGAWRARRDLARGTALLLGPARAAIEGWFESEPLRATLATDAVIGAWAAPSTPGTGYVLFHHVMGDSGGARGVWAYVEGGMGALSEAIASAARDAGAELFTESPVSRVNVVNGRATGITLEDGRVVEARVVVSGADPARTLLGLVGREALPEDVAAELDQLDMRSPSVKINLALDGLPVFRGEAGAEALRGTVHVGAASLDALDAAFAAAEAGELPERPLIELTIPSVVDPSVAPAGKHIASLFVQWAPLAPRIGWDAARDVLADTCLRLLDEVSPGFSDRVLEREVLAPPDLERIFGLTGGNIFHGAMSLDRLLFMRPLPGFARYRTPVPGLYLCGAGTHPGGGVMGACGRNAAHEILRDLRGGAKSAS